MAKFLDLIKSSKIEAVYLQKHAALADMARNFKMINDLDKETPNARTYSRVESYANTALEKLKTTNNELDMMLIKSNLNLTTDEAYISDQEHDRRQVFKLITAMDDYIQLLKDKGITYPPDAKPAENLGDLATLVTNLLNAQDSKHDKLLNTLVSSNNNLVASNKTSNDNLVKAQQNKTSSPKAVQPIF